MYSSLNDKEFVQRLRFIRPSKTFNRVLLKEIEKRDLRNNLYVLNYLKELQELEICKYDCQCLLLSQYDLSDRSSKFYRTKIEFQGIEADFYSLKNVFISIKNKKMSKDFEIFINAIEGILMSTKKQIIEKEAVRIDVQINHRIISDFLSLVKRFKKKKICKEDMAILNDLKDGTPSYKESWLWVFESRLLSEYILFVFYFLCCENQKNFKYQILKNMIEDEIKDENLEIFKETDERFKNYLATDFFSSFEEEYYEKQKNIRASHDVSTPSPKENCIKSNKEILKWYKARVKAFTLTED